MASNSSEILQQAAEFIRSGQLAEARTLLVGVVKQDPASDLAWYLLSFAVTDKNQQADCLKRALQINSANQAARARLEKLQSTAQAAPSPAVSPPAVRAAPPPPAPANASSTPPPASASASDLRTELGLAPAEKRPQAAPPRREASPQRALVAAPREAAQRKSSRRAAAKKRLSPWVWALPLVLLCLALVAGGIYLLPELLRPASPLPTSFATLAPTPTPRPTFGLAPTWTPTPIPSATYTPTVTPTPIPSQTPTLAPPGPTAMSEMKRLEQQVIELRGLEQIHEVPRYVTTRPRYLEAFNTEVYTPDRLVKMQYEEWSLKAMGMISPTFSMVEYALNSSMAGVSGVYIPWKKEIYVFGLRFSGVEAFVYVHEFDHALVDQHYDFNTQLGAYPDCRWDTQRCQAISALVEGDATLLMYLWWQQYASYETWLDFWYYTPPSVLPSGQDPPPYLGPQSMFPYDQGFEFVNKLYERGGWPQVNRAYTNPPLSSEQILHPEKYFNGEGPIPVEDPRLDAALGGDWTLTGSDSLGEWMTYLLLGYGFNVGAQLGDETAQQAASGWGGDHYQTAHNAQTNQSVFAAHWIWDSQAAANEFNDAFGTYQSRRFHGATISAGRGQCWQFGGQTSCVLTRGRETLWVVAPDLELITKVVAVYPDFQ